MPQFSAKKYTDQESKIDIIEEALCQKLMTSKGFADPEVCVRRLCHLFKGPGEKVTSARIDYNDFFSALSTANFVGVQKSIEGLFNRYDFDGTGTIDYQEFSRCMFGLGDTPYLDTRSKQIINICVLKIIERAGVCGIHSLMNSLSSMDITGNHMVHPLELEDILRDFGIGRVSSNELQKMLSYFNINGMVSYILDFIVLLS